MPYNPSNYTRCEKCKHIDRENEKCKITNDNWLVSDRAGTCHQFEGVSMKVRCIKGIDCFRNNECFKALTKDKEYKVFKKDKFYFTILNDLGEMEEYPRRFFEIVGDEIKNPIQVGKEAIGPASRVNEEVINNPIKPSHYQAGEFDVIAFCFKYNLDFASGNVVKYIVRTGKKDKNKELEDLLKAREYLERKIEWVKSNA